MAQMVKNMPAMQETWVQSLGEEDPPEKGATHSSTLVWRIPGTSEPGWGGVGGYSPLGHKESDKTEQLTHMRIESANNLTGSRAQAVMQAMANDCAYR